MQLDDEGKYQNPQICLVRKPTAFAQYYQVTLKTDFGCSVFVRTFRDILQCVSEYPL